MKDVFLGFYRPSNDSFKVLWEECYFVFDTNVLLNAYRYPKLAQDVLLHVFELLSERIWIPYQVGLEYHSRITDEIFKQEKAYDDLDKVLKDKIISLEDEYKKYSIRHTNLKLDETLLQKVKASVEEISKDLKKQKENHPDLNDMKYRLAKIFDGKVGEPFSQEELNEIYEEGNDRYQSKIPPGFKDSNKGDKRYFDGITYENRYGDLVLWKQLIDFANTSEKNIIFITDDQKEDWWHIHSGKTIGPHPELIQEFNKKTSGKKFYMYQTKQFLSQIKSNIDINLSNDEIVKAIESIDNYKKLVEENENSSKKYHTRRLRLRGAHDKLNKLITENVPVEININEKSHPEIYYDKSYITDFMNLKGELNSNKATYKIIIKSIHGKSFIEDIMEVALRNVFYSQNVLINSVSYEDTDTETIHRYTITFTAPNLFSTELIFTRLNERLKRFGSIELQYLDRI